MNSPIPIITNFNIKEKYTYHYGLGNYIESEAFPGALPQVNHHPVNPPYKLQTERISVSGFIAPRHLQLHTFFYRTRSSYGHPAFKPYNHDKEYAAPKVPEHFSPNPFNWVNFEIQSGDWVDSMRLLGTNGDPKKKSGVATWLFSLNRSMAADTAFSSLDGEALIAPQSGALDIQTEYGKMLVRQNEIAVIPRGVKYRVDLVDGLHTRGYVIELYEGFFRLPELGILGSTGQANQRDFQIPTAAYDGKLVNGVAVPDNGSGNWAIISRLNSKLWTHPQPSTPFDVGAWSGQCYPYKFDLAKICIYENAVYDHHDPSSYVILTSPALGKQPGTAVVDIAVVSERWIGGMNTLQIPWFHRNTMSELVFPLVREQDPNHPLNQTEGFAPLGGWLNANMATHGAGDEETEHMRKQVVDKSFKLQEGPISVLIAETDLPWFISDWAVEQGVVAQDVQSKAAFADRYK